MRVIVENKTFCLEGGTEVISATTFDLLNKNGHQAYFFSTDRKPYYIENYEYSKYFPKDNLTTLGYLQNPLKYFWNWEAAQNFEKMIDEVKPDIVHFNAIISPSLLHVCKKKNIPAVMTIHMMPSQCPATKFLYKNKTICSDFKCKNGNYWHCVSNKCGNGSIERSVRKSILSYIYDKTNAYSAISHFICPSDALRKQVLRTNMCNKSQISTINNFLTDDELRTVPNYSNNGYFLYVGRLDKEKGVDILLKALNDLPREIKLHIVGKGSEEVNLKKYVKDNNLYNVKFCGFKNREDIKEEYQNCIATIVPSNWFEIFGMINIESFINGKPVIASNIGGIPEIVENNTNGLLFESTNVEQLKECILKYWNSPKLAVIQGKNGYAKAFNNYTPTIYHNKLVSVYEKVLQGVSK